MSNWQDVAIQVDIGNIPSNAVATHSRSQSLIKATTADNVHPVAVQQLALLGSCFHINGSLAAQVPDLLVRSNSLRLQRLQHWVGWMVGDTALFMTQTVAGQAISLLSPALVELGFDVGTILYYELLPQEQTRQVLSNSSRSL